MIKTELNKSNIHRIGIFAAKKISKDEIIEACPIIILDKNATGIINKTSLYDYYFSWKNHGSAIALGRGSLYNHSYNPNAVYKKNLRNNIITFIALRLIKKGEEITVNYNGDPRNQKKVWFEKQH